ncbi:hypothetical protein TRFO_29243 [Tritrichomonas foetus]|uniref:Uncharacterized protein n=1 Tax=Tritrichomonas foetus TaxID=1144522 RepID=A0A1J4JW63_9EUKA|nr:hypothetical protein TRFO_29243 [Tritrichomonas foetus]|eukprot:OHT03377.1 hypothetical protein TRFO_29243 [Tritrichomonas foetus]
MLPVGDDAENMEQSTLNYVFSLFGKGITQILQQSVNQQTIIDEIRAQNRSLQTQVTNLTASMDEVEDRIFVRLQNMQPTIYTREGIPIDDALDSLSMKLVSINEKMISATESVNRVDAELSAKVDRDEFEEVSKETHHSSESFSDLSNTLQLIQKELQRLKQESQDSNDRMMQAIKYQVESRNIQNQMANEENDFSKYVLKDELNEMLKKLKLSGGALSESEQDIDSSAVVEFALSGDGPNEEKIHEAYQMLQKRKSDLENHYSTQSNMIDKEMSRLMKIAENTQQTNKPNHDEEDENDDDYNDIISEDEGFIEYESDFEDGAGEETHHEREYRNVGLDTNNNYEESEIEIRAEFNGDKRRNIGLSVNSIDGKIHNSEDGNDDSENEIDVEDEHEVSKKGGKKIRKKKVVKGKGKNRKGMKGIIQKMKSDQQQNPKIATNQQAPKIDEGKLTHRILDAVMPRVENLLVNSIVNAGSNGLKLDRNEAKQLITQLSLLDSIKTEMKGLKVKVGLKIDRSKAETELSARITKDELLRLLLEIFPDNEVLKGLIPQLKSKLPPLNGRNSQNRGSQNQNAETSYTKNKTIQKGKLAMRPSRNSHMISLNQKFLKGADGHYYLRDIGSESTEKSHGNAFGVDNSNNVDINAAFDFQPFTKVEDDDAHVHSNVVKILREQTPHDFE